MFLAMWLPLAMRFSRNDTSRYMKKHLLTSSASYTCNYSPQLIEEEQGHVEAEFPRLMYPQLSLAQIRGPFWLTHVNGLHQDQLIHLSSVRYNQWMLFKATVFCGLLGSSIYLVHLLSLLIFKGLVINLCILILIFWWLKHWITFETLDSVFLKFPEQCLTLAPLPTP